jgi:hypothetical protein
MGSDMQKKTIIAISVLVGVSVVIALAATILPTGRTYHFQNGSVIVDGKLYGPPPSEKAFSDTAVNDAADGNHGSEARWTDLYWELGHFYCSRKPPNPPIPSQIHYPPAFLDYVSSNMFDYWLRLSSDAHDTIVAHRQNETADAWAELGGYPADMNGDERAWARATTQLAEWTLCPDGHPNPYAGKIYRPGAKPVIESEETTATESPYQRFAALAARSRIDLARHPSYTSEYFKDRADQFCVLLSEGKMTRVSEEVTFPPVLRFTETTQDRPRLETAILRVAASDICPQNASKEQDWERANVR